MINVRESRSTAERAFATGAAKQIKTGPTANTLSPSCVICVQVVYCRKAREPSRPVFSACGMQSVLRTMTPVSKQNGQICLRDMVVAVEVCSLIPVGITWS